MACGRNLPNSESDYTMNPIEQEIQQKLDALQAEKNCRLLLAVESGSRAWGYASQDSDYDVRCIYYYPQERYLDVRLPRDTVEWELNEVFDITGWELRKSLGLALKSNLTVFEWADSPIVYRTSPWHEEFRSVIRSVMQPRMLASRYLGMAASTMHRYLQRDEVPYKQYFYALRPLLAARWVMQELVPAPVPFADLRPLLPQEMQSVTDELLALRNGSTEKATGPAHPVADAFIVRELAALDAMLQNMPAPAEPDTAPLGAFFRSVVSAF